MLRSITAPWVARFSIAALVCLCAIACSPSTDEAVPEAAEELSFEPLEQRVRERWQALEKRDFDTVWEYATPNYRSRFPQSLFVYNYSYALRWELTSITLVNYDAGAAMASVAVRVMSEPTKQTSAASRAIGALPVTFHEQWLKIDGEWWHSANL